jgi:hypothetical protein
MRLSNAALALFRLHLERRGDVAVTDANRKRFRELARAGLMVAGNGFAHGVESVYSVTREGSERKAELGRHLEAYALQICRGG